MSEVKENNHHGAERGENPSCSEKTQRKTTESEGNSINKRECEDNSQREEKPPATMAEER